MARLFNDGVQQYLEVASPVIATYPFTMACWFWSDDATVDQVLVSVADNGGGTNYHILQAAGTLVGDPIRARSRNGAANADTTAPFVANTWHHACGVFAANNDRRAYLDGANKGTDNTVSNDAGLDVTSIGRVGDSTPDDYVSGGIAEAAIWDVALSDGEVAGLATGVEARLIRPGALVAYWPLWGLHSPEIDCATGAYPMTLFNGPTQADHAPVVPFLGGMWPVVLVPPPVAAGLPVISGEGLHSLVFGGVTVR